MAKVNKFQDIMKRGLVQQKKERMDELEIKIDNYIKDINYALFMTDGVESIDMPAAEVQMRDIKACVEEYLKLKKEVEDLE